MEMMEVMSADDRGGPDSPEAQALLRLMQEISEDYWAAGWLTDLEYSLWRLARGDPSGIQPAWPASTEDGAELRRLSDLCGGWWAWDQKALDVRFVPTEEWQAHVEDRAGP